MSKAVLNDISKFSSTSDKIYSPHPMYETYGPAVSMKEARDKLGLNHEDKLVLFFGLIRHYKGLDILLEAMKHPSLEKQNIKLLIAGEFYEDKQPYLDIIASKELKDRVILRDNFIPKEDVRFYFCASNLVAQTYRNATNSGVTMVGYFYDKPMLVTNVGGLAEIVPDGKCGYLVENSIDKISEKLSEYFEKNKEHEFTGNVKLEKKKYEWSVFINSLLTLYNKC
jgi:glycosyltransferase involved in cell wall biosynthesis